MSFPKIPKHEIAQIKADMKRDELRDRLLIDEDREWDEMEFKQRMLDAAAEDKRYEETT